MSTTGFDLDARARVDRCEFIDPGSLIPFAPCTGKPLDRHRLDVALSRGRHAAERAKLAGCCKLICLGMGADDTLDDRQTLATSRPTRQAAYAGLRRIARFEIAALTGALVAGAQMGLQAYPGGRQAPTRRRAGACTESGRPRLAHRLTGRDAPAAQDCADSLNHFGRRGRRGQSRSGHRA
ncbi:MAG: hypothetical protein MZV65_19585 [Chromatiales bacterium]|nr:hypothetical protein [Chromatiales bacterium]